MHAFEEISRPVIFESESEQFSYWGKGSSFLLANAAHWYWVTAAHVLKNLSGSAQSLRIFPSDESRISLPFNEQYSIKLEQSNDEDYKDLFALRIDITEFDRFGDAPLTAQDFDHGLVWAETLSPGDELWIAGYPAESNFVDYERSVISNNRVVLRGIYVGHSVSDHCHEIRVQSSIDLQAYDGLSGSPVFRLMPGIHEGEEAVYPMIVGMLIRGTASSKTAHFVSSRVIQEFIVMAEANA